MAHRRKKTHPVVERRRRLILEGVGLAVIVCIVAVFVFMALQN